MNQPASKPKSKKVVRDIRGEAVKIANSIKVDGQSKAETTAIAHGIQRGMEQFLRQQSEKTRELDKRVKKAKQLTTNRVQQDAITTTSTIITTPSSNSPWILLVVSWILFFVVAGYFWVELKPQ